MKKDALSCLQVTVGGLILVILLSGFYTFVQLNIAGSKGIYETPEMGMQAIMDKFYSPDRQIKFLYAGTNSFDGSRPHVWYVIAEVRASSRSNGLPLSKNGCESAGLFFLDTKKGWVQVPEGAFPEFMGYWMNLLRIAGPGRSVPSTDWAPDQPDRYCQ